MALIQISVTDQEKEELQSFAKAQGFRSLSNFGLYSMIQKKKQMESVPTFIPTKRERRIFEEMDKMKDEDFTPLNLDEL